MLACDIHEALCQSERSLGIEDGKLIPEDANRRRGTRDQRRLSQAPYGARSVLILPARLLGPNKPSRSVSMAPDIVLRIKFNSFALRVTG
jgi:hypothetical protein